MALEDRKNKKEEEARLKEVRKADRENRRKEIHAIVRAETERKRGKETK